MLKDCVRKLKKFGFEQVRYLKTMEDTPIFRVGKEESSMIVRVNGNIIERKFEDNWFPLYPFYDKNKERINNDRLF